jgi:vesicle-associated membrane protein 7
MYNASYCSTTFLDSTEKVLDRGEKIELLVDKTEALNQTAFKFEKEVSLKMWHFFLLERHDNAITPLNAQSTKLKSTMWWKNVKVMVLMGCLAVVCAFY